MSVIGDVKFLRLFVAESLNFCVFFWFFGISEAAISGTDLALACSLSTAVLMRRWRQPPENNAFNTEDLLRFPFCIRKAGKKKKKKHQTSWKSNFNFFSELFLSLVMYLHLDIRENALFSCETQR